MPQNRPEYIPKNRRKSFFFLIILLSLFFIRCGGGSGGGNIDRETAEGKITVAWDSDTNPLLAGYKIHYGTVSRAVSGQYEHSTDIGMATQTSSNTISYTLRGLIIGRTYYLAVTAYDCFYRESDFSSEVSGTAVSVTR